MNTTATNTATNLATNTATNLATNLATNTATNLATNTASNSSSYNWGETVVLFVSTHGNMIKEEYKQSINKFIIPDGITVKRGSISTPGECHYVGFQISSCFDRVKTDMHELKSNDDEIQNEAIDKIMKEFRRIDDDENRESLKWRLSELKKKKKTSDYFDESEEQELRYLKSYLIQLPKGYTFYTFSPGKRMVNKVYALNNERPSLLRNDMVIKVVENEKGDGIDLLSLLRKRSITLREIVIFLKKKGVKTIIIFDLTCSAMLSPDCRHLNATSDGQRTIRRLRRELLLNELLEKSGGKTKKRRRGKKNKKNKIKSRKHRK